jgi:hypothetical protein
LPFFFNSYIWFMTNHRVLLFSLLTVTVFSLSSCIKKRGCKDPEALNYDIDADKMDYTCIYKTWGMVYWDSYYYQQYMEDSGSVTITAYLDGKYIGSKPATDYGSGNIDCHDSGPLTFWDTVYYANQYKMLLLLDQNNRVVFNDTVAISSDDCSYVSPY